MEKPTNFLWINRKSADITSGLENAPIFKKFGLVKARPAVVGEKLTTTLEDGVKETVNKAKVGDWVVTNPSGEQYIISEEKFFGRYDQADEEGVY